MTMKFASAGLASTTAVAVSIATGSLTPVAAADSIVVYPAASGAESILVDDHYLTELRRQILAEIRDEIRSEMRRGMAGLDVRLADGKLSEVDELAKRDAENERLHAQRLEALRLEEVRLEEQRLKFERDAERAVREQQAALEAERAAVQAAAKRSLADDTIQVGSRPGDATCLNLPEREMDFGSVSTDVWREWIPGVRFSNGAEALSVNVDSDGLVALRQRYDPTDRGSMRVVTGATLPEARTYRIVQSIQFEPGWDWGGDRFQGGKVGFGFSGGAAPSGGEIDPAGFSVRLSWRGNLDGTGRLAVYAYSADRPGRFGEDIAIGQFEAPIGEWFDVVMEVTTNSSINAYDGSLRVWIDGELLTDQSGIGWQMAGDVPHIDNMYYSSFYGGGTAEWAPDQTTFARVANVCWAPVVGGRSGIDPDNGRVKAPASNG